MVDVRGMTKGWSGTDYLWQQSKRRARLGAETEAGDRLHRSSSPACGPPESDVRSLQGSRKQLPGA